MSAHTPGPWSIDWNVARLDVFSADAATLVASLRRSAMSAAIDEAARANARLIAAAPELLEALRDALSALRSVNTSRDRRVLREGCVLYLQTEEWCKWVENELADKAIAAIAKATGGQS